MREPTFRLSVKAIIVESDRLIAIHCPNQVREFYYLPGGGQKYGETVAQTLDRERNEEIGYNVVAHEIVFDRYYSGWITSLRTSRGISTRPS